ncbi:hypothetical protein C0J52_15896 [Blattella germanica]|nr:hypothetical protein C0J52_15896 [Blattella germanica]
MKLILVFVQVGHHNGYLHSRIPYGEDVAVKVIASEGEYGLLFMEVCNGVNLESLISTSSFVITSSQRARWYLKISDQECYRVLERKMRFMLRYTNDAGIRIQNVDHPCAM